MNKPSYLSWRRIYTATIHSPASSCAFIYGTAILSGAPFFPQTIEVIGVADALILWGVMGVIVGLRRQEKESLYTNFHALSAGLYSMAALGMLIAQLGVAYLIFASISLCHLNALSQERAWKNLREAVRYIESSIVQEISGGYLGTDYHDNTDDVRSCGNPGDLPQLPAVEGKGSTKEKT